MSLKRIDTNISAIRAFNQQISVSKFKTAKEIASWMGAIQAQDYKMSKWAFGIRLPDSTESDINKEIDSGNIIRTHLLRPTWHFASSEDIYWILDLSAPQIKAAAKSRDKQLGLSDSIFNICNRIFEKSLRDQNHKTREELLSILTKSGIDTDNNRSSHIFLRAELDGIICSGKQKNGKPTYAILGEWVPKHNKVHRDEALKELASRYFTSHGPATIQDFKWWSGLYVKDVKLAMELNKGYLTSEVIQNQTYWFADNLPETKPDFNEIYLLPAYDEFLISYHDRSSSLSLVENKKVISNNGIFYPTIMHNGQVIGTWKRNMKNNRVIIVTDLFKFGTRNTDEYFTSSLIRYSGFTGKVIELNQIQ